MLDPDALQRRLEGTLRAGAESMPTPMGEFKLEFLAIDPTNLEFEMSQIPVESGWTGTWMESIKTQVESKKLDIEEADVVLKQIEGQLYLDILEIDKPLGARDPLRRTVDAIKATIVSDQHVLNAKHHIISLKRELVELDYGRRQVNRIVMALDMKSNMLQSTGAMRRSNMELQLQSARAEVSARQTQGEKRV